MDQLPDGPRRETEVGGDFVLRAALDRAGSQADRLASRAGLAA